MEIHTTITLPIDTTLNVVGVGAWNKETGRLPIRLCYTDVKGRCFTDNAVIIHEGDGLQIEWFEGCPEKLADILEQLNYDQIWMLDEEARDLAELPAAR